MNENIENLSVNNKLHHMNYGNNMSVMHNATRNSIDFGIEDYLTACCIGNREYEHLYSIWILEKKRAAQESDRNRDQHPSFSLHDESHSRIIISCIELLLGQERIYSLTPTDAWLILMCAYQHDLGMLVDFEDLRSLLEYKKEDYAFLNECKRETAPRDVKESAFFITEQLSEDDRVRFVKAKGIMEWPPMVTANLSILLRHRARKDHHKRIRDRILSNSADRTYGGLLTITLVEMIADICQSHGLSDESLMKLEHRLKGAGRDYVHPRFVAMLLRLGDLLDMDSNRFNPYIHKYIGKASEGTVAYESIAHEIKHYATRNVNISPEKISAVALFEMKRIEDSFGHRINTRDDTHKQEQLYKLANRAKSEINRWFGYINDSVSHLSLFWQKIVPEKFPGPAPMIGKLAIVFNNRMLCEIDFDLKYRISNFRASQVFEGVGMYDDWRVFLRELIQNAWDATKLHVYEECRSGGIDSPTAYMQRAAQYPVKLKVKAREIDNDSFEMIIKVEDSGTGIDIDKLRHMKNIGDAYNPSYVNLNKAPEWLKPTSAFGIGLQSVFSVTDEFKMATSSRRDLKRRVIIFGSSKFDGEILCAHEDEKIERFGTTVEVTIVKNRHEILKVWQAAKNNEEDKRLIGVVESASTNKSPHPLDSIEPMCLDKFREYISRTVFHDIVPVKCSFEVVRACKGAIDKNNVIYEAKPPPELDIMSVYEVFSLLDGTFIPEKSKLCFGGEDTRHFMYWDNDRNIFLEGWFFDNKMVSNPIDSSSNYGKSELYFRGMKVEDRHMITKKLTYPLLDIKINILCGNADKTLIINRQKVDDRFVEEIATNVRESVVDAVFEIFIGLQENTTKGFNESKFSLVMYLYFSYLLWIREGRGEAYSYTNRLRLSIVEIEKQLYQSHYNHYKEILGNHISPVGKPYFDSTFVHTKKSTDDSVVNDWLVGYFGYHYKEITSKGRNIKAYKASFTPVDYINFIDGAEAYWKYVVGHIVALCEDELNSEDEEHLAYVFPVTECFKNIAIKTLPFATKNKRVIRYGRYILSPFSFREIKSIYDDISNNKFMDIRTYIKKIINEKFTFSDVTNLSEKYVLYAVAQVENEHPCLSTADRKSIKENYRLYADEVLNQLHKIVKPYNP